ncbi:MAG: signal peptidase I [Candidatus Heimdallarchaeota archaeon]
MQRSRDNLHEKGDKRARIALVAPIVFFLVSYALIAIGTSNPRPIEVVMSPSMSPHYEVGDLLIVRNEDPEDLRVGDIVIYEIDFGSFHERILHQVWNISIIDGKRYFALYGELNGRPDVHKGAKDVIHKPAFDDNGRRIIISLVPAKAIKGQVIYKIRYLGWPIAILISFDGLFALIFIVAFLYWFFYERSVRLKKKGLVGLAVITIAVSLIMQGFSLSGGHIKEVIELSVNDFGETIEPGDGATYQISGEIKQIWGPTSPTGGLIDVQILAKNIQNMTVQLTKKVNQWTNGTIKDINYIERLTINHLGLVIASDRLNSEYLGFYFPFITLVNASYIVVNAFAYSVQQLPSGINGEDSLQFVQDMQKWDYSERYWFSPAGYLTKYEYRLVLHPYVLPHLLFINIISILIGLGYWKIEQSPFFFEERE